MDIRDIANILNGCANLQCDKCKHYSRLVNENIDVNLATCQAALIDELGREIRQMVAEMEE